MAGAEIASSARTATAMRADVRDRGHDAVAGANRAHSLRRAGEDEIPGVKRVQRRRHLDQLGNAENQVPRVRLLTHLAVDRDLQIERARIRDLVGGHEPRPEHAVAVRRLAEAAILGPSNRDVEPDRVAGHVRQRILTRDAVRALRRSRRRVRPRDRCGARDSRMTTPSPGPTSELVAFRNRPAVWIVNVLPGLFPCSCGSLRGLVAVLLVVHRRRDDLARIGDRAEQRDRVERPAVRAPGSSVRARSTTRSRCSISSRVSETDSPAAATRRAPPSRRERSRRQRCRGDCH